MKVCLRSALLVLVLALAAARGEEVLAPQPGTPLRQAILDDLRAAEPTVSTQKEKKQKIIFEHVILRVASDWAWVAASPRTQDGSWRSEALVGLMHRSGGHWSVVEYVDDGVWAADEPSEAFLAWRAKLLKRHPKCPEALVPKEA